MLQRARPAAVLLSSNFQGSSGISITRRHVRNTCPLDAGKGCVSGDVVPPVTKLYLYTDGLPK